MSEQLVKKFIRTNFVDAEPMKFWEYKKMKQEPLKDSEDGEADGFKVTYTDGYVSWCPKARFLEVSVPCNAEGGLPFGYAMMLCRYFGARVQRKNWNGEEQFVRYESVLAFENGKLPDNPEHADGAVECKAFVFHFKNRKTGERGLQVGWLASQADLYSDDWVSLDPLP